MLSQSMHSLAWWELRELSRTERGGSYEWITLRKATSIHREVALWRCGHCSEAAVEQWWYTSHVWMQSPWRMEKEEPLFERASGDIGGRACSNQRWKCVCRLNKKFGRREFVMAKYYEQLREREVDGYGLQRDKEPVESWLIRLKGPLAWQGSTLVSTWGGLVQTGPPSIVFFLCPRKEARVDVGYVMFWSERSKKQWSPRVRGLPALLQSTAHCGALNHVLAALQALPFLCLQGAGPPCSWLVSSAHLVSQLLCFPTCRILPL